MFDFDLLAKIDTAMMMVDVDLMEWQGHLDMASLAGVGFPFELWTEDEPPKKVTPENFESVTDKPVRVMHMMDGQWSQIGTGQINSRGVFTAEIDADVPELAIDTLRHFSVLKDLPAEPSAYQTLVATPGSGVVELDTMKTMDLTQAKRSLKGFIPDIENNPFFKENE